MTSSEHPSSASGEAADLKTILLPPPHSPAQPADTPRHARTNFRVAERLLLASVLVLAFLLASTPARNSDVWLHLASGRLLASGAYSFGSDPFSVAAQNVRWVNPSWLYDLLSFLLFQAGGGVALLVAKALGITVLAWILLRICKSESATTSWTASVLAAVALIVVGSSLPLRPIWVSYLFLALTLWLLETRLTSVHERSLVSWWPVPVLFALWANLDAWFLLGPLTVGLYLLGTLLQGRRGIPQARQLGLVLLVGLAACLVNPYHYHIFALPPLFPFTPEAAELHDDPIFIRLWQSPFQTDFFHFRPLPHAGRCLYFVLLVLSIVSIFLNVRGAGSRKNDEPAWLRRVPAWLAFFALSALDVSLIPLLAIIAAPLTALNLADYQRRQQTLPSPGRSPSRFAATAGRLLTLLGMMLLLVAAWPGWLQGQLREPRGWTVETDLSLVAGVQQTARWRQENRIGPRDVGFNFSPTAAHYAAWFAPEEKGFWDSRWRLFTSGDPVTVRRALLGDPSALDPARRILRRHRVTHLLLHDSDPALTAGVFQRLVSVADEWPILFLKGDTVVLGWRDPERRGEPDPFAGWRLNFHRRAFDPADEEQAPAHGPSRSPDPSTWRGFWTPAPATVSHDAEEAALYLIYFDSFRPAFLAQQRTAWECSRAAGMVVGMPSITELSRVFIDFAGLEGSLHLSGRLPEAALLPEDFLAMQLMEQFGLQHDEGPPALLVLALRAARRAIEENPQDARAYQILGEGYLHLLRNSRERLTKLDLPALALIRQIQAACALQQALLLQPDRLQPHIDLYVLYRDMDLLDLALDHARAARRIAQARGQFPGESKEALEKRLGQLQELIRPLEEEVQRRLNNYEVQAVRRSVLEQAVLAREQGLGGKCLEILLGSDVAVFGQRGAEMEMELLLAVGRIHDAREWMTPGQGIDVSKDSYRRFRILVTAAEGNYEACDEQLAELSAALEQPIALELDAWTFGFYFRGQMATPETRASSLRLPLRQALTLKTAALLLEMPWHRESIPWFLTTQIERAELLERLYTLPDRLRQRAELDVIRSALALERGAITQAQTLLPRALSLWQDKSTVTQGAGLDFDGRRTAEGLWGWLTSDTRLR